jgi:hypothetical protein
MGGGPLRRHVSTANGVTAAWPGLTASPLLCRGWDSHGQHDQQTEKPLHSILTHFTFAATTIGAPDAADAWCRAPDGCSTARPSELESQICDSRYVFS